MKHCCRHSNHLVSLSVVPSRWLVGSNCCQVVAVVDFRFGPFLSGQKVGHAAATMVEAINHPR